MLIEFRLENYRSIRDPQVLSMVASSGKELPENTCEPGPDANLKLLRSAVIYGANAAGKSNLVRALEFMRETVLLSAKESQQGEKILVKSFLFDKKNASQPSKFEITFITDKVRYQYGFVLDEDRIFEEWLNAYPLGRMQQWFNREYDAKTDKYKWKFGKLFTGKKQLWKNSTRRNALFLSTAVQLNNEQLTPVFSWFQNDLVFAHPFNRKHLYAGQDKSFSQLNTPEGKKKFLKYMRFVDPSITDVLLETRKISENATLKKIITELKKAIPTLSVDKEMGEPKFIHTNNSALEFINESQGTKNFFALAGHWVDAMEKGKVIVVDELDNSLHSLAVQFLIRLISNPKENKQNSQLIFTTHDTSLLDSDLFRRDQVWFVEKDKHCATQLYPLLDFSPRTDEAVGRGYLQGRYGALPYIGNWSF